MKMHFYFLSVVFALVNFCEAKPVVNPQEGTEESFSILHNYLKPLLQVGNLYEVNKLYFLSEKKFKF